MNGVKRAGQTRTNARDCVSRFVRAAHWVRYLVRAPCSAHWPDSLFQFFCTRQRDAPIGTPPSKFHAHLSAISQPNWSIQAVPGITSVIASTTSWAVTLPRFSVPAAYEFTSSTLHLLTFVRLGMYAMATVTPRIVTAECHAQ